MKLIEIFAITRGALRQAQGDIGGVGHPELVEGLLAKEKITFQNSFLKLNEHLKSLTAFPAQIFPVIGVSNIDQCLCSLP